MLNRTTTTYSHLKAQQLAGTKIIGAPQKATVTMFKGAHLLKWLAALCALNSVGAATVPSVTTSVTTLSQFVPVSEGTLVTAAGNNWYKTAQWSGMANDGTTQSVAQVLAVACLAAPSCVGFLLLGGGRLGVGALLYDSDGYTGAWPPETPDAVAAAGAGNSTWNEGRWSGRGEPAAHGSVEVGKGWNTWEAFRRLADHTPPSKMENHATVQHDTTVGWQATLTLPNPIALAL